MKQKSTFLCKATLLLLTLLSALALISCTDSYNRERRNIILVIGDGMGEAHIEAGELYSEKNYDFTNWPSKTFVHTNCLSQETEGETTTDSAAAGTAMATGTLTYRFRLGKSILGEDLATILDYAKGFNMSTGIVSTDYLYGATPAAFAGHAINRYNTAEIIESEAISGVDLLIANTFSLNTDIEEIFENNNYSIFKSFNPSESEFSGEKVFGLVNFDDYGKNISLVSVVEKAIDFLSQSKDGFVLVVEQAFIDKHANDTDGEFENLVKSVDSLNTTVDFLSNWGEKNEKETGTKTVIIVTADHETGGLSVSSTENLGHSYNGIYYNYLINDHTSETVPLFINMNFSFKNFSNFASDSLIRNTDIFCIMSELVKKRNY